MTDPIIESKTAEAAHAAAVAEEAHQEALEARLHDRVMQSVQEAIRTEMSPDRGRYVDLSRVPLICQAILGINEKMSNITSNMVTQDQFWPVKTLVYGFVAIVLFAVVAALILLVVPHAVFVPS